MKKAGQKTGFFISLIITFFYFFLSCTFLQSHSTELQCLSYCFIHNNTSTKEYDEQHGMSSRKSISGHFIPYKKDLSATTSP